MYTCTYIHVYIGLHQAPHHGQMITYYYYHDDDYDLFSIPNPQLSTLNPNPKP
jgi:hypothetical protein